MNGLHNLKNTTHQPKRNKRVGRGPGSGLGKTSGRGHKGAGSRSGYKRRLGTEGGQLPLYRKLPCRGFSRAGLRKELDVVNLFQIDKLYADGEVVNAETLEAKGFLSSKSNGFKVLSKGELSKKVKIEAHAVSAGAKAKLEKAGIEIAVVK